MSGGTEASDANRRPNGGGTGAGVRSGANDPETLSRETLFRILTDTRRRYVVHLLKQRDERLSVREIADQVAAWENGKSIEELSSKERKRVYVSLYQSHLDTLADEGIVEYDTDRGEVELTPAAAAVDINMEVVPKANIPWSHYYLGLTAACGLALALVWLDVRPFTTIPDLGWAVMVLAAFGISAAVETYDRRRMRFGDEGPPPELRGDEVE